MVGLFNFDLIQTFARLRFGQIYILPMYLQARQKVSFTLSSCILCPFVSLSFWRSLSRSISSCKRKSCNYEGIQVRFRSVVLIFPPGCFEVVLLSILITWITWSNWRLLKYFAFVFEYNFGNFWSPFFALTPLLPARKFILKKFYIRMKA